MMQEAKQLAWRAGSIPAQLEAAFAESIDPDTGEIINEQALQRVEALAAQKTVALTDLGLFVKQADSIYIAHLDSVIAELKARKARIEKARDIAQAVIEKLLPVGEKLETDFVTLSWRKSEAVVVDGAPELLPEKYQRVKITVDADKTAIKAAIKAGEIVPGARLEVRQNLQIK